MQREKADCFAIIPQNGWIGVKNFRFPYEFSAETKLNFLIKIQLNLIVFVRFNNIYLLMKVF